MGGQGKGSRDIQSGNVSKWSGDPCGVLRDAGAGCQARPRWEDTGLLNAEFTLLFLGQKSFVCSVRVLASLKGTVLLEALSLSTVFQDP